MASFGKEERLAQEVSAETRRKRGLRSDMRRLHELYWGINSRYPSLTQLSLELSVSPPTLTTYLKQNGIPIRGNREQQILDYYYGRRKVLAGWRKKGWAAPPLVDLSPGPREGWPPVWIKNFASFPLRERVGERLVKRDGGCLLWPGRKTAHGYGRIKTPWGDLRLHRIVWQVFWGPIPVIEGDALDVHHLCGVKLCARPSHLALTTHALHRVLDRARIQGRAPY